MNRPLATLDEYEYIKAHSKGAKNACFISYVGRRIDRGNNSIEGAGIMGATNEFKDIRSFELQAGRYFSLMETNAGRNVTVIGHTIAEKLFRDRDPIGKYIEFFGSKVLVIGVVEKEGKGTFSGQILDDVAMVPLEFFKGFIDIRKEYSNPQIWVQAKPSVGVEELTFEITQHLRSLRRLKPLDEDNFALNQTSIINNQLDQFAEFAGISKEVNPCPRYTPFSTSTKVRSSSVRP